MSPRFDFEDMPLGADLPHTFWTCERCEAQNSCLDGECQFCDPVDCEQCGAPARERGNACANLCDSCMGAALRSEEVRS